jgi:hypothetical protein
MPSLSAERVEPRKEILVSIEVFLEGEVIIPKYIFANDIVLSFLNIVFIATTRDVTGRSAGSSSTVSVFPRDFTKEGDHAAAEFRNVAGATKGPASTPYSGGLSIFEYPDLDKLQIDRVMDLLGIAPGKKECCRRLGRDGLFTVRASRRVGPTGSVIAEDISPLAVLSLWIFQAR